MNKKEAIKIIRYMAGQYAAGDKNGMKRLEEACKVLDNEQVCVLVSGVKRNELKKFEGIGNLTIVMEKIG